MAEGERKERTPAQYELIKEEPRAASNAAAGGQLYDMLDSMKKEGPGDWFRIVTCNSRSGANGIKTNIEKGKRKIPTGVFEFTTRTNFPEDGKSALYARFVAEDD